MPRQYPGQHVLEGLDPEQRAAVTAARGPVCILAGAGTGKTRTITHRIAYLVGSGHVDARQVLAVTFTARAAGEMRTRLRGLGVQGAVARTFHAAALRQLRYFWPRVVDEAPWELLERKVRMIGQAAGRAGVATDADVLRDLAAEIEWAKASLVTAGDYPAVAARTSRKPPVAPGTVAEVYSAYERLKNDHRALDFDDLLLHTTAAIEGDGAIAEEFRDRYRCFVVDEYQDITPLQQRLLDAWLGGRDDLTVVGDANQTIYSFGGASPRPLLDFRERFPTARLVRLERGYRSTPQVLALANTVISRAEPAGAGASAAGSSAAGSSAAGSRLRLIGQRDPGPQPRFSEFADEHAEAEAVADRIGELLDATAPAGEQAPASEMAVLYRVNAQAELYEQALARRGIAYLVRGGERFFHRQEVRAAVAALRTAGARAGALDGPAGAGDAPWGSGAGEPEAGAGKPDAGAGDADAGEPGAGSPGGAGGHNAAAALPAVVREVLAPLGFSAAPPAAGTARERWDALAALVELADEFAASASHPSLPEFVTELDRRAEAGQPPTVDGVTLASLHAAKGLEWDAVFLVGLADGTVPISHAEGSADAVEEERRLFYVGLTRARKHLWLSWALARSEGGRRTRKRSRFLRGLVPGEETGDRPAGGARPRRGARAAAGDLPVDEALLERLKVWRTSRAKELAVPAYVVFTDATLAAIAAGKPSDERELVTLPGIGQTKLTRFGPDVLALVRGEEPPAALGGGGLGGGGLGGGG